AKAEPFFQPDDQEDSQTDADNAQPGFAADRRSVEEAVHYWRVGEEDLRDDHRGNATDYPRVGEQSQRPDRVGERTAIEQIECFGHYNDVDDYRPRFGETGRFG